MLRREGFFIRGIISVFGLFVVFVLLSLPASAGKPLRLGLVPLDNRPVCLSQVVKLAELAGMNISVPPYSAIGAYTFPGDPDAVLDWMEREAPNLDVLILSVDMAVTGGIVPSRTPLATMEEVNLRLDRLERIASGNPHLEIWAFGILQRIARTDTNRAETNRITWLISSYLIAKDEADATKNLVKAAEAESIRKQIPEKELGEYLAARRRNHETNMKTIGMASQGLFRMLVIGMDDNAVYGPQRTERDELTREIERLDVGDRVTIKPGADELAQLLTARASMRNIGKVVEVYVDEADPALLKQIPPLEDRPLNDSIDLALRLSGAKRSEKRRKSDRVLYVHGDDGLTSEDAAAVASLVAHKRRVSVADVAQVNAGSTAFAEEMGRRIGDLGKLAGYGGWNTAANAIGTAVAMLIVDRARDRRDEKGWTEFLMERFSDDALFMGDVRPKIQSERFKSANPAAMYVDMRRDLVSMLQERSDLFFHDYFADGKKSRMTLDVQIPWFRLFEIGVNVRISPETNNN